jgi:ABC-type glycerol-3-phosphate transport system permease component
MFMLSLFSAQATLGGPLQPPGPPAPTARTLESLGFDCPNDPANTTNLLFSYVTNAAGFDTGISISNTGTDPFGTVGQAGTCTFNWYGAAFTGATPTPNILPGTTYVTLVSTTLNNVTGGFSGYMIAQCRFSYAHGFAFISDLGARNLAMGYLAPVVCSDRRRNSMGSGR